MGQKEGGNSSQINSFFNFSPSRISSHREELCLLDSVEEKDDLHAEAYKEGEVLAPEVSRPQASIGVEDATQPFTNWAKSSMNMHKCKIC